jgi:hypothetical protein
LIKLPPIEKIYESYSAAADNRVSFQGNSAKVISSSCAKEYTVTWDDEVYTSNDNASYWQGYAGYPMIAVLMLQGKLSLNKEIAEYFKGINWTELNAKYKGKYSKAVEEILNELKIKGIDCSLITSEVNKVYDEIKELNIKTKRSKIKINMKL